jgi:hypothetical protein
MKKIDIFNLILVVIAIIGGVYQSIYTIASGNLYGTLIRLGIIPIMLLPYIFKYVFKKNISVTIMSIYIVFIFFSHFLGSIMNLYKIVPNYDKLMHLLSGMLSALFAIIVLVKWNRHKDDDVIFDSVFMLSITMLIASLWEFYEFTFDRLFNKDAQLVKITGSGDTMLDMLAALIGCLFIITIYVYEVGNNKPIIIKNILRK